MVSLEFSTDRDPSPRRAILALLVLGALSHLIGLSHPRQVVFDEVHWGKFVTAYCCTGERMFDVHPPAGKLLLTLGAVLGGYDGSQSFESIGLPYERAPVFWLRLIPAASGIAIPVLFFLFLRGLGGSIAIAWLGGFLLAFDNALILETRTMMFDGILVASSLGALVCLLWSERVTARWCVWAFAVACGVLAGLAVATKFTGLAVPALIGAWLARSWWRAPRGSERRQWVWRGLVIGVSGAAVYLSAWMIHFALLTQPGPGDAFHPTTGRVTEDLVVAHRTMMAANAGMTATHPDASHPITWPIMKVHPFFWSSSDGAVQYMIGNPVVWWGSTLLLVGILAISGLRRLRRVGHARPGTSAHEHLSTPAQEHRSTGAQPWWLLIAYGLAYLPFFGVSRVLFMYHYFTPLVFALAFVLMWLEGAGWTRTDGARHQRASYYGVMAAAVVGFVLMSPLTYGFTAGAYSEWLVAGIRSWR